MRGRLGYSETPDPRGGGELGDVAPGKCHGQRGDRSRAKGDRATGKGGTEPRAKGVRNEGDGRARAPRDPQGLLCP